ncbi:MAG: S1C family serine protease [Planctomycetota bacterium]|nr:S1C family serine protease [Planctomycetota bacterium]
MSRRFALALSGHHARSSQPTAVALPAMLLLSCLWVPSDLPADDSYAQTIAAVQPKMVKIYGAGGIRGLEAYQSGLIISDQGHVLTVWSYVLDTEDVVVVLNDGRRFQSQLIGADPRLGIAILRIELTETPYFTRQASAEPEPGDRILAFSNLYGVATGNEPASVLHGTIAARTQLAARRGAFKTTYKGPVFILDAMTNNPGAAGGALTDRQGNLIGLLGKELRNAENEIWLNYAIPIAVLANSIDDLIAGRTPSQASNADRKKPVQALNPTLLGFVLIPDVLDKTPAFVDNVRKGSVAEKMQLQPDDLILFANERIASTCKQLVEELSFIDRIDPVTLTIQRGQNLIDITLQVP